MENFNNILIKRGFIAPLLKADDALTLNTLLELVKLKKDHIDQTLKYDEVINEIIANNVIQYKITEAENFIDELFKIKEYDLIVQFLLGDTELHTAKILHKVSLSFQSSNVRPTSQDKDIHDIIATAAKSKKIFVDKTDIYTLLEYALKRYCRGVDSNWESYKIGALKVIHSILENIPLELCNLKLVQTFLNHEIFSDRDIGSERYVRLNKFCTDVCEKYISNTSIGSREDRVIELFKWIQMHVNSPYVLKKDVYETVPVIKQILDDACKDVHSLKLLKLLEDGNYRPLALSIVENWNRVIEENEYEDLDSCLLMHKSRSGNENLIFSMVKKFTYLQDIKFLIKYHFNEMLEVAFFILETHLEKFPTYEEKSKKLSELLIKLFNSANCTDTSLAKTIFEKYKGQKDDYPSLFTLDFAAAISLQGLSISINVACGIIQEYNIQTQEDLKRVQEIASGSLKISVKLPANSSLKKAANEAITKCKAQRPDLFPKKLEQQKEQDFVDYRGFYESKKGLGRRKVTNVESLERDSKLSKVKFIPSLISGVFLVYIASLVGKPKICEFFKTVISMQPIAIKDLIFKIAGMRPFEKFKQVNIGLMFTIGITVLATSLYYVYFEQKTSPVGTPANDIII